MQDLYGTVHLRWFSTTFKHPGLIPGTFRAWKMWLLNSRTFHNLYEPCNGNVDEDWLEAGSVTSGADEVPRLCTKQPSSCSAQTSTWCARLASADWPLSASPVESTESHHAATEWHLYRKLTEIQKSAAGQLATCPSTLRLDDLCLTTFSAQTAYIHYVGPAPPLRIKSAPSQP